MDTGGDGVSVDAHNLISNLSIIIGLDETDTFTINMSGQALLPQQMHSIFGKQPRPKDLLIHPTLFFF